MYKRVIVENNRVKNIVVAPSLDAIKLGANEVAVPLEPGRTYVKGEKLEGNWKKLLKVLRLK